MRQNSFSGSGFEKYRKKTRKEQFLEEMETIIPWKDLCEAIEPFYPKPEGAGRRPVGIERMLRIHFLQHWFNLSDPAAEEALYDSQALRSFVGIDLGREPAPDETTICKFRHLMEKHNLGDQLFHLVNQYLQENGMKVSRGTIVDASIISAPSSTKNKKKERDPEMRQTKKGNQWYFGMKAHIGVDSQSGLVHTVTTTPANEADVEVVDELLHGKETTVHADAGYTGAEKRVTRKNLTWQIAAKRGRVQAITNARKRRAAERRETAKARIRARVEHPFRVIKRQFGLAKVRFRGLAKNTAHVITLFALSNLWMVRRKLLAMTGSLRPELAR